MATQGSIVIWNYTKLISKFPEVQSNDALKKIIGGFVYENPFNNGKQVLVSYDGDNLNFPNGFYPDYTPGTWLRNFSEFNFSNAEVEKAEKILDFLLNECCEADWQVWN